MLYRLIGADVFDADHVFRRHDVYIKDDIITTGPENGAEFEPIDVSGLKLIPGLVDIHFHGCLGYDFCDGYKKAIEIIAEYEESNGITSICPATMSLPKDRLIRIAKTARSYHNEKGSELVGINMEGPFISSEKKGAQNPDHITAFDTDFFDEIMTVSGGIIKLVDIAPELPGALDFIEKYKDMIKISLAHTCADYDTAKEAFVRGIHHMTHIYNAMNTMDHRHPGPVFAAADDENVEAEIICDGIHIHPSVVRSTLKLFGSDRVIFISDSMEATGMPDGEYELGGMSVKKQGKRAVLSDGTLAGSVLNLMDCLRTAVLEMDIPLETAVKCASENPARSIGIYNKTGSIEPGKSADLVALDDHLDIKLVINKGRLLLR